MKVNKNPETLKSNMKDFNDEYILPIELDSETITYIEAFMTYPLANVCGNYSNNIIEVIEAKIKRFKSKQELTDFIKNTSKERAIFLFSAFEKTNLINPETFETYSTFCLRYACFPYEEL